MATGFDSRQRRTMSEQIRSLAPVSSSFLESGPGIDLILLTEEGDRFVVQADGGRITALKIVLPRYDAERDGLVELVERVAQEQIHIDVGYLGMLSADLAGRSPRVVVAAVLRSDRDFAGTDPRQRIVSLAEIKARGGDVDHGVLYETAWGWHQARVIATDLNARIQRAFETSLLYLDNHLSVESGRWGWNLYMDGSSIGLLSTAEGLLSHAHAGAAGEFVNRPAETLESMQNPDGGWQVRRSLVGAHSDLSITESTGACLLALYAAGRTASDPVVRKGIVWLEEMQRGDGGWPSSGRAPAGQEPESLVFPTTCAVRALARFGRTDAVAKGVAWLRSAQQADGGWSAVARAGGGRHVSSPAYTAYAIVALLDAGLTANDAAVERACKYLRDSFDPEREEPWISTSHSALIDPTTSARLDFRHFGTPWALAALCQAGYDLSDPMILLGLDRLLGLQESDGAWRCGLVPAGSTVMWTTHDALYALHHAARANGRDLLPLAQSQFVKRERAQEQRLSAHLLRAAADTAEPRRNWLQAVWLSALTVAVVIVALAQLGLFKQFQSSSLPHKLFAALATIITTTLGAVIPQLVVEGYRVRRNRGSREGAE
jgi:prenyltransferase beta subunit